MAKIKAVGLVPRTVNIMNNFFNDIDKLKDKNLTSYQINLFIRVKKFFDDMNNVGVEEFVRLLEIHPFKNTDSAQQPKYTDAFNCLVAFIVAKYDESDLLSYFLPEKYSIEDKPALESNTWRIVYWVKFLTYWLGSKLFNRQKFKTIGDESEALTLAINSIKQALNKNNYFDLNQNPSFNENLETVVSKFIEKRHVENVEHAENDNSSNGDVLPQLDGSDEPFIPLIKDRFKFESPVLVSSPLPPVFYTAMSAGAAPSTSSAIGMTEQPIASNDSENLQSQKITNSIGKFFSGLIASKKGEVQQPNKNSTFNFLR